MSDYETLQKCKIAWEILNDLKNNCILISDNDNESKAKLDITMNLLCDLYQNAWELLASNNDTYEKIKNIKNTINEGGINYDI